MRSRKFLFFDRDGTMCVAKVLPEAEHVSPKPVYFNQVNQLVSCVYGHDIALKALHHNGKVVEIEYTPY